jgi:aryl-alcohol dehydrogenase-like predicted oxidoreductase
MSNSLFTRRNFIRTSAITAAGISVAPYISCTRQSHPELLKRTFGNLGFEVTTFGLGGQASIQWTPPDVDPVKIILKAFDMGVNYFDTSNLYGPSQTNWGKAFRMLDLIPGQAGYNETLRKSIWLTSKTHLRWAKGGYDKEGVNNWTNGENPNHTAYVVKRSLSQIFGDGNGNWPEGAYLDMVLIHNLNTVQEVDVLYEGIENTDPGMEHIGALAVLRDLRDGTNLTGLNPGEEKLIRHIGFSGHYSAPVMMEMIRRDKYGILDGMLVAINANDRLNLNMQHNVIPVASAKGMGVIAMKVFADGAMYTKKAEWSNNPDHVVRTVGSRDLPSGHLVRYSLTTPGIHTAIIGIGHIDDDDNQCQLTQNIQAAQITPDGLSDTDRREVEAMAVMVKEGRTNYFQIPEGGLTAPLNPKLSTEVRDGERFVNLTWDSAYAGDESIKTYEIWRDNQKISEVVHIPQTTRDPFKFSDKPGDKAFHNYKIVTVDAAGKTVESEELRLDSTG